MRSEVRGHLGLGVELRVEEAAEDVLAQARAAVQRPRGVVTLRVHLVLGMEGGVWRMAAWWPGPRLVTDQQSVTLLLAAAAWLPGQRWSPNWFRTTFILHINLWAPVTIHIISGQNQCIYIQWRRNIYCLYLQT